MTGPMIFLVTLQFVVTLLMWLYGKIWRDRAADYRAQRDRAERANVQIRASEDRLLGCQLELRDKYLAQLKRGNELERDLRMARTQRDQWKADCERSQGYHAELLEANRRLRRRVRQLEKGLGLREPNGAGHSAQAAPLPESRAPVPSPAPQSEPLENLHPAVWQVINRITPAGHPDLPGQIDYAIKRARTLKSSSPDGGVDWDQIAAELEDGMDTHDHL